MFEFICTNVTNQSRPFDIAPNNWETAVMIPRVDKGKQLVSETFDGVVVLDPDDLNIAVGLRLDNET